MQLRGLRRTLPRWLRLASAASASFGIWLLVGAVAPMWAATLVGFVFLAVASGFIEAKTPELFERAVGDAPLLAAVGANSAVNSDGWEIALPGELLGNDYPKPGVTHLQARAHLSALGGYDVEESRIRVALEGRSVDTVIVTGMRARIGHTEPPIADTLVQSPSAGAGTVMVLTFDLDKDDPQALSQDGSNPFAGGYITLSRGEIQIFELIGRAGTRACAWRLEIAFRHRERQKLMLVPDAEQPFRTTPRAASFARSYHWAWFEQPSRIIPMIDLDAPVEPG